MQRTINTIETRVNGLGLAESAVQPRGRQEGEGEILVQLPGVDDPARIKQILQTAAVLELYEVKDGPFSTEEEARAKHGGILPLNTKLIKGAAAASSNRVAAGDPHAGGSRLRSAGRQAAAKPDRAAGKRSSFSPRMRASALSATRKRISATGSRSCWTIKWRLAPTINGKIGDTGSSRTWAASRKPRIRLWCCAPVRCRPVWSICRRARSARRWAPIRSARDFCAGIVGIVAVVLVMLVYYKKSRHQRDAGAGSERAHSDCGARLLWRGA